MSKNEQINICLILPIYGSVQTGFQHQLLPHTHGDVIHLNIQSKSSQACSIVQMSNEHCSNSLYDQNA